MTVGELAHRTGTSAKAIRPATEQDVARRLLERLVKSRPAFVGPAPRPAARSVRCGLERSDERRQLIEVRAGESIPVAPSAGRGVYRSGGETQVAAIDPERMLSIVDNDELASVAAEVKARLRVVVESAAG